MNGLPKLATCVPKLSGPGHTYCGRRGMPQAWVDQMYADYLQLGSLAKVGARHNRSRQSMYKIFKRHGLKLRAKHFRPVREYRGRKYTEDGHGYLRDTVWRSGRYSPSETFLHRRLWIERHGPIPPGYVVAFKNGDRADVRPENLELLTREQQQARSRTGENGSTKTARARLSLLLAGKGKELARLT